MERNLNNSISQRHLIWIRIQTAREKKKKYEHWLDSNDIQHQCSCSGIITALAYIRERVHSVGRHTLKYR